MNSRQIFVLLLSSVLLALKLLVGASPPDPTWIGGVYDDGDYDQVIFRITEGISKVQSNPYPSLTPIAVVVGFVPPISSQLAYEPVHPGCDPSRGPPVADPYRIA